MPHPLAILGITLVVLWLGFNLFILYRMLNSTLCNHTHTEEKLMHFYNKEGEIIGSLAEVTCKKCKSFIEYKAE